MYQFLHVDSYSLSTPKKGKRGGHSVSSIISEAVRNPNSCPHIAEPRPPVYIYGKDLEELESACIEWSDSLTKITGRKTRKDALCLVAGVISAPNSITPDAWEKFRGAALEWLKNKYRNQLHTVVEHVDESHPHIHFYVVPCVGHKFESVHDGKLGASMTTGVSKGAQNQAYKAAMRAMLDNFNECVGLPHGMLRLGPGRRRLTRRAWREEQAQAASIAVQLESIKGQQKAIKKGLLVAKAKLQAAYQNARVTGYQDGIEKFEKHSFIKKMMVSATKTHMEIHRLRGQVSAMAEELTVWKTRATKINIKSKGFFSNWQAILLKYSEAQKKLSSVISDGASVEGLNEELVTVRKELREERRRRTEAEISLEAHIATSERISFPESANKWLLKRTRLHDEPTP